MMEHEKIFVLVREDSNGNSENVAMSWLRQDLFTLFTKLAEVETTDEYLYSIQCFDITDTILFCDILHSASEQKQRTPSVVWDYSVDKKLVSVEILTLAEHDDEQDG